MEKVIMLARANIRKSKGQSVILAALFLISSMMLNVGLTVLLGFGSFMDRTAVELNASEASFAIPMALYTEEVKQYLANETMELQQYSALVANMKYAWDGEQIEKFVSFNSKSEPRGLTQWKLVGESLPETQDAIYVPYVYKVLGGYSLGDALILEGKGKTYHFTVAGYFENIYNDRMTTVDGYLVPEKRYLELSGDMTEYAAIYANGVANRLKVESALINMTGAALVDDSSFITSIDYPTVKASRTQMAVIMSAMMLVFTAVIAIVCLLVIRFRISNSIEEDMPKIGSLQSIGYTSRQITLSMAAQYGMIALVSSLAGTIPAYLTLPLVGDVFAQQSGLLWEPGFEPLLNIATVGALTIIVVAVAWLAALKIRRINPVAALRGGIATHSFKRNYIPLEKTRLPLTPAMSLKSALQGFRQSATMFAILVAVSFTAVIAVVLYYNAAVDLSAFAKVPGFEKSNAAIIITPEQDPDAIKAEVLAHNDVWKAQYLDARSVTVDGIDVSVVVMEDYSVRETNNAYTGVFPRYGNEIAISGLLSGKLGKRVGDEVLVGENNLPYLITGLTQGMDSDTYITTDGIKKLAPDYQRQQLQIYLNKGTDAAAFTLEMEKQFEGRITFAVDGDKGFADGVSGFASIMSMVGIAILFVAAAVIILVLYFVIGSAIIRKRRELGIQKAIGYTTANLMNQISLGFLTPILLGAAAGCFLGAISTNLLMSVGMAPMGVVKAGFIINAPLVAAAGVCIVVLAYLTSILITWRIRKISAYSLVTE